MKEKKFRKAFEEVINSQTFKDRELYIKILSYLYDASKKNQSVKEVDIAHNIFHKNKNFDPVEDTSVRVHIHKLRKMLDYYYLKEGRGSSLRLYIPKGHYQLNFTENDISDNLSFVKNLKLLVLIIVLLCSLCYIAVDKLFLSKDYNYLDLVDRSDPVWKAFFTNSYPGVIIFGDFFVFHEYDQKLGRTRRIQDYQINNKEEFESYAESHKNRQPEEWVLGEIPHNSVYNLTDISNIFLSFREQYKIDFTTNIDINFINKKNIIYIGEFKNLRVLNDLLSVLPIKIETLPWWHGTISIRTESDSTILLKTKHDWSVSRYVVDLGLVAKLPGENNEVYFIFAGFGYNSQVKIVNVFSHHSSLKLIEEKLKSKFHYIPEYFAIIFEVKGFDRASTTAEIKYIKEVFKTYQ